MHINQLLQFRNYKFYEKGFLMFVRKLYPYQFDALMPFVRMITSQCQTKNIDDRCEAASEFLKCVEEAVDFNIANFVDAKYDSDEGQN